MPVLLLFAMLCLWEGSQWLLPGLALDPIPFAWTSAAAFTLAALIGEFWLRGTPVAGKARLMCFGAFALAVPTVLLTAAEHFVSSSMVVAALAGVPVVAVVAEQVISTGEDGSTDALLPAITGLAGTLLVVPVGLPGSTNGWIGFALALVAVLLVGIFGVVAHDAAEDASVRGATVAVARGAAIAFGLLAAMLMVVRAPEMATVEAPRAGAVFASLAVGTVMALIAVLLLRSMRPLAFASRFLVIPLLTAVEGYAVFRPTLSLRAMSGAGLMALATLLLLRSAQGGVSTAVPSRSAE